MSSLDQDRLLAEGSEPVPGPASTARAAAPAGPRTAAAATPETALVPPQRQVRSRSTTAAAAPGAMRPTASAKAGASARTARSTAVKAAAVAVTGARSASAKAATTKAATIKVAAAAKAVASTTVGTRRAGRTASKTAVAKAVPAKAAPGKAPPGKKAAVKTAVATTAPARTAAARRPTPYPRDVVPAAVKPPAVVDLPAAVLPPAPGAEVESAAVVVRGFAAARRLLPSPRRRPALYLAAALVAATSVGTVAAGGPQAVAATSAGHSVSIAHELGIDRRPDAVTPADAQHLRLLAASRNERGAEELAAARVQAAADQRAIEAARPKAVLPVTGARLTSPFGMRWGVLHAGIDLAAPLGTPEYAAMDGVVLRAGPASGFGLAVYIQHANGDVTVYGHMEKILVTEGQVVRAGQTIALLGENGQATGPHLHFEVHVGGMLGPKIDPIPWLRARGVAI